MCRSKHLKASDAAVCSLVSACAAHVLTVRLPSHAAEVFSSTCMEYGAPLVQVWRVEQQEEGMQMHRFNYNPRVDAMPHKPIEVYASIPQHWYQDLLDWGGLQVSSKLC